MKLYAMTAAIVGLLGAGCAEPVRLTERGVTGTASRLAFWPPPEPTSVVAFTAFTACAPEPCLSFEDARSWMARSFHEAGYNQLRAYGLGLDYAHGFAVTTRLERMTNGSAPDAPPARWFPLYPEAAELRWLEGASEMRLPAPGHYRVFLVALTDLPIEPAAHAAPRWNQETVMVGAGVSPTEFPARRALPHGARIGVYFYEYECHAHDGSGAFVAGDAELRAEAQVRASGLWALAGLPPAKGGRVRSAYTAPSLTTGSTRWIARAPTAKEDVHDVAPIAILIKR